MFRSNGAEKPGNLSLPLNDTQPEVGHNHPDYLAMAIEINIQRSPRLSPGDAQVDLSHVHDGKPRQECVSNMTVVVENRRTWNNVQSRCSGQVLCLGVTIERNKGGLNLLKTQNIHVKLPDHGSDPFRMTKTIHSDASMNVVGCNVEQSVEMFFDFHFPSFLFQMSP
jgi:hypothetical protein